MKFLHVFDFDGTLFNSPLNIPENHKKYERSTGIPWLIDKELSRQLTKKHGKFIGMRRGWFGRPETLEPPLVPSPAPNEWFVDPVCQKLQESKNNPDATTVLLTGRHSALKNHVFRICHDGKLIQVEKKTAKDGKEYWTVIDDKIQCFFLGDDGPLKKSNKPGETFPWKIWIIEQFLEIFPEIELIEIWEDRPEHVEAFRNQQFLQQIIVNHVK